MRVRRDVARIIAGFVGSFCLCLAGCAGRSRVVSATPTVTPVATPTATPTPIPAATAIPTSIAADYVTLKTGTIASTDSHFLTFGYEHLADRLVCYNIGNDVRFRVSGTTAVALTIDPSALSTNPADAMAVRVVIDGVAADSISIAYPYHSDGVYALAEGLTTGSHLITLQFVWFAVANNRWTSRLTALQITRFQFDAGAAVAAGIPATKKAMWYTDSLGEYDGSSPEDAYGEFPVLISRFFGWDSERFGYFGSGYLQTYYPPNPILYDPALPCNWIDSWNSTDSRLFDGKLKADYLFIALGTNDQFQNADALIARITATLARARAIFDGPIFAIMPPTTDADRATLLSAYSIYAKSDSGFHLIDVGTAASKNYATVDGVHLTPASQASFSTDTEAIITAYLR